MNVLTICEIERKNQRIFSKTSARNKNAKTKQFISFKYIRITLNYLLAFSIVSVSHTHTHLQAMFQIKQN